MSVQYLEPIMDEIERKKYIPFVGYINPGEQLIDYSTLIGEQTHYSTKNPASMMFLRFVSYVIKDFNPEELKFFWDQDEHIYKNNKTNGFDNVIKRGFDYFDYFNQCSYDEFLKELNESYELKQKYIKEHSFSSIPVYDRLQNDLMYFFHNAYQNENFFKSIGTTLKVDSFDNYVKSHKKEIENNKKLYSWLSNYSERDFYNEYQIAQLMSYFKDIMVMYLGYDSIERRLRLNPKKSKRFKVITTSCLNPN